MCVPSHDVGRIVERHRQLLGPRDERVALFLVVPRGPDDNRVESGPVSVRIVPHRLSRIDAAGGKGLVKRTVVDLPRGYGRACSQSEFQFASKA
jgi:hypothetical protein